MNTLRFRYLRFTIAHNTPQVNTAHLPVISTTLARLDHRMKITTTPYLSRGAARSIMSIGSRATSSLLNYGDKSVLREAFVPERIHSYIAGIGSAFDSPANRGTCPNESLSSQRQNGRGYGRVTRVDNAFLRRASITFAKYAQPATLTSFHNRQVSTCHLNML